MPFAPYQHQVEALQRSRGKDAFGYLMGMRCVDANTEYLSPEGWRRIGSYSSGRVAEFRLDGTAHFVDPIEYIKSPVDRFWHLKSKGGVDQVLSENHRILACGRPSAKWGRKVGDVPDRYRPFAPVKGTSAWRETSPAEMSRIRKKVRTNNTQTFVGHLPTSFHMVVDTAMDLTVDQVRLMVAFHADGTLAPKPIKNTTPWRGRVRIKKDRKKTRMRLLLQRAEVEWQEKEAGGGFTIFSFVPPKHTKSFGPEWWAASYEQQRAVVDEVVRWDGGPRKSGWYYSSRHQCDVDFVQYCFASQGFRTSIVTTPERPGKCSAIHQVYVTGNGRSSNLAMMPRPVPYEGQHDGFMYSFSVPSTYLVLRRNGKVFVTGNTGKTKVTIDDWQDSACNFGATDLAVLAPAGVYKVWLTELEKHVVPGFEYDLGLWDSNASNARRQDLAEFLRPRGKPRAFLMNTEALSSAEVNVAKEFLYQYMASGRAYMAVDESTMIKNPTSNRTYAICALGTLARMKRILTGLPTPNTPLDAYAQFAFLDQSILGYEGKGNTPYEKFISGYKRFHAHHAVTRRMRMGGRLVDLVVDYRNEHEIRDKIIPHSYRKTLRECNPDVPFHAYATREVELTREQKKAYSEMKAYMSTQLESGEYVSAQMVVTCAMRLHQICCGHVTDEEGEVRSIKTNRMRALAEVLEEFDGKGIVWCSYDPDVRAVSGFLRDKYGDRSVAQFWGGNAATREEDNRRFQQDPRCRWMVATPSAGGRGRDWSVAEMMLYYSNTENLEHRDQSEERASKVSSTDRVTVVDLITRGTVEEKIVKSLREKLDMAASITGDSWREWVV